MSPFADSQTNSQPWSPASWAARPAILAFIICLVIGFAAMGWRARQRSTAAAVQAQAEVRACVSAMESQLTRPAAAAEVLAALVRLNGGSLPNFQRIAPELLAAWPGLASLELQPGGTISDIAPRAGQERALGFNAWNDPLHRVGAQLAFQRKACTLAGPVALPAGGQGVVARVPIFGRGRDGREAFWGFAAATVRLPDLLAGARFDELAGRGYHSLLFVPASDRQPAFSIAARGAVSEPAALSSVRVQNLEWRLAIQPRQGSATTASFLLQVFGVLLFSGIVGLCANLLVSSHQMETELADTHQRLARETLERKQAAESWQAAKESAATVQAELQQTRATIQQADVDRAELRHRLESSTQDSQQKTELLLTQLQEAEAKAFQLQQRLEAAVLAQQQAETACQEQLAQVQTAWDQEKTTATENQAQLRKELRAQKEANTALQAECQRQQSLMVELQARIDALSAEQEPVLAEQSPSDEVPPAGPVTSPPDPTPNPALEQPPTEPVPEPEPAAVSEAPSVSAAPEEAVPAAAPPEAEAAPAAPAAPQPEPQPASPSVEAPRKPATRRKKTSGPEQIHLFGWQPPAGTPAEAQEPASEPAPVAEAASTTPAEPATPNATEVPPPKAPAKGASDSPSRPLPPSPPVNLPELRKMVHLIVPLLADRDPGARDCLKANRSTFRSAFSPEGYVEFENCVRNADYDSALDQLKRAAKKHGITA
jgi:hypothetical protein